MPCTGGEPNSRELESVRVMGFLYEVGLLEEKPDYYGDVARLDEYATQLCAWCYANKVNTRSLELQIWWRDHQVADKARVDREIKAVIEKKDRDILLSKLTDYEKSLLGL